MTIILQNEDPARSSWEFNPVRHAYRTYLSFLQTVFHSMEGTAYDQWSYNEDPKKTKLNISGRIPLDAEQVAARPTIIATKQGIASSGGTIGDMDYVDPFTGAITFIDEFRGTLAVYVLSQNDVEADNIAWLVRDLTWTMHRSLISNEGFHSIGRNIQVGDIMPPGSLINESTLRASIRAIPLSIPYSFKRRMRVTPTNARRLERLNLNVTVRAPDGPPEDQPPASWTVERWMASLSRLPRQRIPSDPGNIPSALPTEVGPGRQSECEVTVRVDLID